MRGLLIRVAIRDKYPLIHPKSRPISGSLSLTPMMGVLVVSIIAFLVSSKPICYVCLSYGHLRIVIYCLKHSQQYLRKDDTTSDLDP